MCSFSGLQCVSSSGVVIHRMEICIYNTDIMKQLCIVFPIGGGERIVNMGFIRNGVAVKGNIRVGRETVPYLKDLYLNT